MACRDCRQLKKWLLDSLSISDIVLGEGQVYDDPDRPLWSSEIDFLLSIIGFAVDVANIWK